mmetsp:Transcript_3490/g.5448  ORF Transcript_3490/g.5448 Transcript_3490/m.5448 type:complete len:267 (+) Transcript_3490:667-1467(+)
MKNVSDIGYDGVEWGVVDQAVYAYFDGRHARSEGHHAPLLVAVALGEGVLQHRVQDSADAERRLDHTGQILGLHHRALLRAKRNHVHRHLVLLTGGGSLQLGCPISLELCLECLQGVAVEGLNASNDFLLVCFEPRSDELLVRLSHHLFHLDGLWQTLRSNQRNTGFGAVLFEIVARSICVPHALNPPVRHLDLHVPAVCRVVSHLCLQVLTQTHARWVHSNAFQPDLGACHEISESFVIYYACTHRLPNGGDGSAAGAELCVGRE